MNSDSKVINKIKFRPTYKLSNSALAQIMVAMQYILDNDRTDKNSPLYKWACRNIPFISSKFEKLLTAEDPKDWDIRYFTLGCNGLPRNVSINMKGYHDKISLGRGNLGPFLDAAFDRINFILDREEYPPLCKDETYIPYFENLQKDVWIFRKHLINFQRSYRNFLKNQRNTSNLH